MESFARSMMMEEMQHAMRHAMGLGCEAESPNMPPDIVKAEAATMSELAPYLPRNVPVEGHTDIQMLLRTSSSLAPGARNALFALWEQNIKHLAEGTDMETDDEEKREEMFDSKTRFIILLKRAAKAPEATSLTPPDGSGQVASGASADKPKKKKKKKAEKLDFGQHELVGYCSFRFDREETLDEEVMVQVIYCYELQLAVPARGKGLGKMLMKELEKIGRARGMEKAFLTCLSNNMPAARFYGKIGYTRDDIDPSQMYGSKIPDDEALDYWILSKSLRIEQIEEIDG